MTLKLPARKRCCKCEGSLRILDYKYYCNRCGFQPPYTRDGQPSPNRDIVSKVDKISKEMGD